MPAEINRLDSIIHQIHPHWLPSLAGVVPPVVMGPLGQPIGTIENLRALDHRSNGRYADTRVSGGTTPYSSDRATASIELIAPNDAPSFTLGANPIVAEDAGESVIPDELPSASSALEFPVVVPLPTR